jgi:hypothetical protein
VRAEILGFPDCDIPVLIRARLLRSLGNLAPAAPRFFSTVEVRELAASRDWLDNAQHAVSQHNQRRNSGRISGSARPGSQSKSSFIHQNE